MNLQFELTNLCNCSCLECPHRFMKKPKEHMSPEVFNCLLDNYIDIDQYNTVITHLNGEPLLHPQFKEIVESIAKVSDAKVDVYSNGLLLNTDLIDFLTTLENKVWLLISFHFYNHDGKLNDYKKTIDLLENVVGRKKENLEIVLATHVTDLAKREDLEEWKSYWERYVDLDNNSILRAVHVNTAINPWAGLIEQKNTIKFDACPYSDGQHLFVGVTGNVLACCIDLEEEITFGNILTDSKEDMMKSRGRFYDEVRQGVINRDVCKRCLA